MAQATRQIIVEATAVTFDDRPLEDVVLALNTGQDEYAAKTDAAGIINWSIEVPEDQESLLIRLTGGAHDVFPRQEQLPLSLRLKTLSSQYHIDELSRIFLSASTNYSVSITAHDPVQLTGRVVDSSGTPLEAGMILSPGFVYPALTQDDGSFIINGVKRNSPAWLFVDEGSPSQVYTVKLSPVDTAVDTDLGEVVLDPAPTDAQIKLSMTKYRVANPAFIGNLGTGLSLISTDGSHRMYRYWAVRGQEEGVALLRGIDNINSVASGEYYVVPDMQSIQLEAAILDAIESGVDLSSSGIPTVTAVSGQLVEQTLDMRAAYDAIIDTLDPYK